jgi:peptidoglycan/xylan/chitin deacetylase (PgdA/CDA1 family)
MKNQSRFIISLDFELFWGVRDKRTLANYGKNISGVRTVIPSLLKLFESYNINATFATVGFLFAKNKKELLDYIPADKPRYTHAKYSPYENNYLDSVGNSEEDDIYHYGASLIKMIQQSPGQEIASHTFSHYYCLENALLSSFEADLLSAKAVAASYGIELKSMVFPRNQYTPEHIEICRRLGFIAYRGNQKSSIYNPRKNEEQDKKTRAMRLIDSYINISGHHSFKVAEANIVNIPASSFLRPYSSRLKLADGLRLQRIKNSMSHAARSGEGYHLWWHPHNFGVNLRANLAFLEEVLKHYQLLHKKYGMESKTMKSIAEEILKPYVV